MTIKRKATKAPAVIQLDAFAEDRIGEVINRGGKIANDDVVSESPVQEIEKEEETRFTLRIPNSLIKKIDKSRRPRVGNVSRNQWIIEVISKAVESKE